MSESPPHAGRNAADDSGSSSQKLGEGLSQFLGKVLDQLSLSAWMPATMLVGNIALLTQLHSQHNLDLGSALISLTERPLGIIIVLLFSVVLAAIVTQAFQFEAIRLFEGYWGAGRTRSLVAGWRVRRHVKKVRRLEVQRAQQLIDAYRGAREKMLDLLPDLTPVNELQAILAAQIPNDEKVTKIGKADLARLWSRHCPAERMRRLDALDSKLQLYPKDHRILPTRLGNTLRSYEDRIRDPGGDLQGFVLRIYSTISPDLKIQHDQFRTRLDMYCSLVFVFLVLAILGPLLLASTSPQILTNSAGALLLYASLGVVSYGAAITSARGYGSALLVINEERRRAKELHSSQYDNQGYL